MADEGGGEEVIVDPQQEPEQEVCQAKRSDVYDPSCGGCLARVPCISIFSWIVLVAGCGGYAAGTVLGIRWLAEIFDTKLTGLWIHLPWIFVIIAGMTVLTGTLYLFINHLSSGATSRNILTTTGRNKCVRCCDAFCLILAYKMQFCWTVLFAVHTLPLLILCLMTWCRDPTLGRCVDLRHYGLWAKENSVLTLAHSSPHNRTVDTTYSYQINKPPLQSAHICFDELARLEERVFKLMLAFGAALVGALLVLIANLNFIICLAGNFKHVKEIRHIPYMLGLASESGGGCAADGEMAATEFQAARSPTHRQHGEAHEQARMLSTPDM